MTREKHSKIIKILKDTAATLAVGGLMMGIYFFNPPFKKDFRTNDGKYAEISFSPSLGLRKPEIAIYSDNTKSRIQEVFAEDDKSSIIYKDSTGREYKITSVNYTDMSNGGTRNLAEGDSLSRILRGKIDEFKGYLEDSAKDLNSGVTTNKLQ